MQRLIIEDVRRMARYAASMTDGSLRRLEQEAASCSDAALQEKEKELRKRKARLEKLDAITSSIYEDKVAGKVSETRCLRLMAKYENEQRELRTSADELDAEISAERQRRADTLEFVGIIASYKDISGLTRAMINELVERIEVHTVTEAKQGAPRISVTYKQDICIENSLNQQQEVRSSILLISTKKYRKLYALGTSFSFSTSLWSMILQNKFLNDLLMQ